MTQTTTHRPDTPMPADATHALAHLRSHHGWDQNIVDPGMIQAHRYAHGLDGRPDLIDARLTHTHYGRPPARQTNWWAWISSALALAVVGFVLGMASIGNADGAVAVIFGIMLLGAAAGGYFMPTIIATSRRHHNVGPVAVINFFLGWTLIGWVVALAMAVSSVRNDRA